MAAMRKPPAFLKKKRCCFGSGAVLFTASITELLWTAAWPACFCVKVTECLRCIPHVSGSRPSSHSPGALIADQHTAHLLINSAAYQAWFFITHHQVVISAGAWWKFFTIMNSVHLTLVLILIVELICYPSHAPASQTRHDLTPCLHLHSALVPHPPASLNPPLL